MKEFAVMLSLILFAPTMSQAADREIFLGTIHKDTVLAVLKIEVERPKGSAPVTVLQGPQQVEVSKVYTLKRFDFMQGVLCNQPYRWRIVDGMFWGSGSTGARQFADQVMRIPVDDLPFYDKTNLKRDEQYRAKYPEDKIDNGTYRMAYSWGADPVGDICGQKPLAPGDLIQPDASQPFPPTPGVFFDVFPSADNKRLRLFILDQDKMRIWDGVGKRASFYWKMDWGDGEWGREPNDVERFQCPFKEAFTVFVRDKDYYFVTEYGNLYLARDPGEKKARKVELIWEGKRQPIMRSLRIRRAIRYIASWSHSSRISRTKSVSTTS